MPKAKKATPKSLPIICGDKTCYDFTAKQMCRFVGTSHFGQRHLCMLYRDKEGNDHPPQRVESRKPRNVFATSPRPLLGRNQINAQSNGHNPGCKHPSGSVGHYRENRQAVFAVVLGTKLPSSL